MRSTLLFFGARATRFAAAALLGTTFVTACDDQRPTEPIPTAAAPTKPSDARLGSYGVLVWKAVDVNQTLLAGSTFEIDGGPNKIQWVMPDNNAGDVDMVSGKFQFPVAPGLYDVCEKIAPANFVVRAPKCKTVTVPAGVITDVGVFVNDRLPTFATAFWDYAKNYIGGGSWRVQDSTGTTIMNVVDNNALDLNKANGYFSIQLPYAGKFSICEASPPPGYYFGQPAGYCITQNFALNTGGFYGPYLVLPPYSATWATIRGFWGPQNSPDWIGPSSFVITQVGGAFTTTIDDNGQGDLHNMVGIFYVKLPGPGTYNICQATKIPGFWLPNPLCHQVTAQLAKVTWGDYFINPEEQVVYTP
jgi:hypothetical protein